MEKNVEMNIHIYGFPGGTAVKDPTANAGDARDRGSIPWLGRSPGGRRGTLPPVLLPGKLHGQRSLADYSPWGCKESDTVIEHMPQTEESSVI